MRNSELPVSFWNVTGEHHCFGRGTQNAPICRIQNPIPYVSTPPSHPLEKGIRGGDPSAVRSALCNCVLAQSSAVTPSRESSVLALATTDIPVSPHTSNGEILAIVDSGTEILNKELTAYLEANHTNHIVCSKDEHASFGAAENSICVLRRPKQ